MSAAGWYPDPELPGQQRYFDGEQWTEHRSSATVPVTWGRSQRQNNSLSIGAFVCGGLAILFCPILLGPAAIVMGAIALSRGEPLGGLALGVGIVGMVLGLVLGALTTSML